jgi:hypothetical protein
MYVQRNHFFGLEPGRFNLSHKINVGYGETYKRKQREHLVGFFMGPRLIGIYTKDEQHQLAS